MSIKLIEMGKKDLAPFMYPHKCVLESHVIASMAALRK